MKARPKTVPPVPDPLLVNDDEGLIQRLIRLHGEPWDLDERNLIASLNPFWWAALFHTERHILRDADEGFFEFGDEGFYEPVSASRLLTDIGFRLLIALRKLDVPQIERFRAVRRLGEMVRLLEGIADIREPFNHRLPILALANGVIELRGGHIHFRSFSPEYLLRHKAPVAYIPGATCPRFEGEFLGPMLPKAEDRDLLMKQSGLMLLDQNPAQRMAILEGDSSAGKTSYANALVTLIGENRCIQLRTEHLEKQFEMDALRGRSLLLGNDVGANFLSTPGAQTLKGLVSNDIFHPEAKNRRDRRPLRGPFNVLIGTNCKLAHRAQGDAAAWRRRLVVYECQNPSGRRRIPNFVERLLVEEGSGILNLLLDGCRRGLADIAATGDLVLSEDQAARIEALVLRSEPLETFVMSSLVPDADEDVTVAELTEAYHVFCNERGWRPLSEQMFGEKVAVMIGEKFGRPKATDIVRDGRKARGWRYLRLQVEFRSTSGPF